MGCGCGGSSTYRTTTGGGGSGVGYRVYSRDPDEAGAGHSGPYASQEEAVDAARTAGGWWAKVDFSTGRVLDKGTP
ncbi:hypothetical protein ACMATS_06025 [Streptoverticillium reticulum]|uniref:DUF7196 family protein n=1 Tax=Streptoverticillium reticulum TaxID=1433415 RepID=UPI0039BF9514